MTDRPYPVVLDACVLVNFALCDTLLRLAEQPRLFVPLWSDQIMAETTRTLLRKLEWPASLVMHFESELRTHFADAWVPEETAFLADLTNDPKVRHVLATAIVGCAPLIVTFNLRHFGSEHLQRWGVRAVPPEAFLTDLYEANELLVMSKLRQQAKDRGRSLRQLLSTLRGTVPGFVDLLETYSG